MDQQRAYGEGSTPTRMREGGKTVYD